MSDFTQSIRSSDSRSAWIMAALSILVLVAYHQTVQELLISWLSSEDGEEGGYFGILVVACAAYLVTRKLAALTALTQVTNVWAGPALIAFVIVWFLGMVAEVSLIYMAMLPMILLTSVTFLFGLPAARLLLFPVAVVLLAIPMWWPLAPYLQDIATLVTEFTLRLLGKPVFVEGHYISVPGGRFLIDISCSGLRFLLVSVILGFISAELFNLDIRRTITLLALAVCLALVANWLRILIVIYIGDYTNMQHPWVRDHYNLGWVVYGVVVLLPFFMVTNLLGRKRQNPGDNPRGGTVMKQVPASNFRTSLISFVLACLIILSGPVTYALLNSDEDAAVELRLPVALAPWELATASSGPAWEPAYENADLRSIMYYRKDETVVQLSVVYYGPESASEELTSVNNLLTDGVVWQAVPETSQSRVINIPGGEAIEIAVTQVRNRTGTRKVIWHWYKIGNLHTLSPLTIKLSRLTAMFSGRTDGSLITISSDCASDCSATEKALEEFFQAMYLNIQGSI